jgi:alpha-amylase
MDELLRYYIPFQAPEKTIDYLRACASESGAAIMTYADDGEKFGSWPHTHKHVYLDGWLERFFRLLVDNSDWIEIVTFAEALRRAPPKGQVWLPDASYREMMEWVLPVKSQHAYRDIEKELKEREMWERSKSFVKGGFWRSFRTKYPEANDMYAKMWLVSDKVAAMPESSERREAALDELYQGQCNCPYWHGVFGGLYLPHLRYAIYQHLIRAENIADEELKGKRPWCESQVRDYNFDGRDEVLLTSPNLSMVLVPHRGGHLVELDIRAKAFNPLAVLTRREEAYHRKVLQKHAQQPGAGGSASIHDMVLFKSEGLEKMLQYDPYKREGLIDHVLALDTTPEQFARVEHAELGDFVEGEYAFEVSKRRNLQRVLLARQGSVNLGGDRAALTVRKDVSLGATQSAFTVDYELIGPPGRAITALFGVEMAYSMLAAHADDRWYYTDRRENKLGPLATRLDIPATTRFGLVDGWQQLDIALGFSSPARVWAFPLETVSQSEGGFEAVYQGSIVLALWTVELKNGEPWTVTFDEAHLSL